MKIVKNGIARSRECTKRTFCGPPARPRRPGRTAQQNTSWPENRPHKIARSATTRNFLPNRSDFRVRMGAAREANGGAATKTARRAPQRCRRTRRRPPGPAARSAPLAEINSGRDKTLPKRQKARVEPRIQVRFPRRLTKVATDASWCPLADHKS